MNNLPSTHDSLIENLEEILNHTTDPLTMSVLSDELFEKYEKIRKRRGFKSNKSDDKEDKRGSSLPRPSREDATSMESLGRIR